MDLLACLLALLVVVEPTIANNATDAPQQRLLDASLSPGCPTSCASFHAGASTNSTMVCTYAKSGVGYLSETLHQGLACYPAYNCREDWNVCIQWIANTVQNTTHPNVEDNATTPPVTIPTTSPLSNLSDTSLLLAACQEITALQAGGSSGTVPPSDGWKPTSLGWRKGSGNIGCGWGSTYSNVDPTLSFSLADFGRVVKNGVGNAVECCMEAMKYEGVDMAHGGAAIRFDVYNGHCRIDRELMMRGNLDTSGGRPLNTLDHCGSAQDFFYWRPAAGAADAANLKSAGTCARRHNFTKVVHNNALKPLGRLPDGAEIPNRLPECNGDHPDMCYEALRYNAINTAEGCCEACASLKYLPDAGVHDTPCVAFQIVDGKCRVLREKWFDTRYGTDGLGSRPSGNLAMSITQVIDACSKEDDACLRADNSHGHWGSCNADADVAVNDDCNYFSPMYYRDLKKGEQPPTPTNTTNTTYRKIQVMPLTGVLSINTTLNVTILTDRTTKRNTLTNTPPPPTGTTTDSTAMPGYDYERTVDNGGGAIDSGAVCAQVSMYMKQPNLLHRDLDNNLEVYDNPGRLIRAVYTSNACCQHKARMLLRPCALHINMTSDFLHEVRQQGRRRLQAEGRLGRMLTTTEPEYILVYECVGAGKDLCDVGGSYVDDNNGNALVQTTTAPSPAGWNGRRCCQAANASCMACAQGVTLEELCQAMPATKGCKERTEGGGTPSAGTPSGGTPSAGTPSAVNTMVGGEESAGRRLRWMVAQPCLLLWAVFFVHHF